MKSTKLILCLVAALSTSMLAGESSRRIPIQGVWDQDNPVQFRTDTVLHRGRHYTIQNNTNETIYVFLVEDRTPRGYFPVLSGGVQEFSEPTGLSGDVYGLDLFLRGLDGSKLNGNSIVLRETL